jgi:hypothetical protein
MDVKKQGSESIPEVHRSYPMGSLETSSGPDPKQEEEARIYTSSVVIGDAVHSSFLLLCGRVTCTHTGNCHALRFDLSPFRYSFDLSLLCSSFRGSFVSIIITTRFVEAASEDISHASHVHRCTYFVQNHL